MSDKTQQSTSLTPSFVTLPNVSTPYPSLLDFFDQRFPRVGREIWLHRLQRGKICDDQGRPVSESTPYQVNKRLRYFREVEAEYIIPFQESILFCNDHILVADKPHFLPVTPGGAYVNECLLHRLKRSTGLQHLVPVHRLDRETAGIVLFTVNEQIRAPYFDLFRQGNIDKSYEAVASRPEHPEQSPWLIESRIERGEPWLRFRNVEGEINARSKIQLIETKGELARFKLQPITGKTHQLRLHLDLIGSTIVGDRLYPDFKPPSDPPGYNNPLQLLAKRIVFSDPLTGENLCFESKFRLAW